MILNGRRPCAGEDLYLDREGRSEMNGVVAPQLLVLGQVGGQLDEVLGDLDQVHLFDGRDEVGPGSLQLGLSQSAAPLGGRQRRPSLDDDQGG